MSCNCNTPALPRTSSSWPTMVMQSYINPPTHSPCISPTMSRGRGWWQPLPVCDGSRCEKDNGFLILGWVLGWAQRAWTRLGPGVIGLGQTRCRSLLVLSSTEVTAVMEAAASLSSGTSSVLWQKGCSVIPGQFPVRQNN